MQARRRGSRRRSFSRETRTGVAPDANGSGAGGAAAYWRSNFRLRVTEGHLLDLLNNSTTNRPARLLPPTGRLITGPGHEPATVLSYADRAKGQAMTRHRIYEDGVLSNGECGRRWKAKRLAERQAVLAASPRVILWNGLKVWSSWIWRRCGLDRTRGPEILSPGNLPVPIFAQRHGAAPLGLASERDPSPPPLWWPPAHGDGR